MQLLVVISGVENVTIQKSAMTFKTAFDGGLRANLRCKNYG